MFPVRELINFVKHKELCNSVILKIQDIAIFAVKFSKSVSLMKLAQGKHREFVNRILVGTLLFNP